MDFLVGDTTGLLRRVDAATRCTYTYKILPQDRNEGVCCSCWSGGQGLSISAASEAELTLGRRSGRVEAMAPALPPRLRAEIAAVSPPSSSSSSSVPHLLIRSRYTAAAPVIRCFQMPAACVQVGLLHEPQDRVLLNAAARDDLMYHDPFFSVFNSLCPLSPSPLLPTLLRSPRARGNITAADATDTGTPPASTAAATEGETAEGIEKTMEAAAAASAIEEPRQLFCIDEVGHLVLLDWNGSFSEQLRRNSVNDKSSSDGTAKATRIYMDSVPSYKVKETKQRSRSTSSSRNREREDACSRNNSCDMDCNDSGRDQRSGASSTNVHSTSSQPASLTAGKLMGDAWYCWSLRTPDEDDEIATHIRAAWRVCGPVSCATPVNPLLPDRIAFGGKNNDVKVFDFSQEKYIWAAKNVKSTLLRLQVPVHISSVCWIPQVHPLVLAAGTAAGALRLYDLRCQRRPVFEQEYACSSSSLGGAAAREPRHLSALCTEALNEEAAAVLARYRRCMSNRSSGARRNSATWRNMDAEGDLSSRFCRSNASPLDASNSLKEEWNVRKSSSSANVGLERGNRSEQSQARTSVPAGTPRVPEDEEQNRMKEAVTAVRNLYGREKTRVFFSDNYGAVYVHRILTGTSFLRRVDPQQRKYNKTSRYAVSSSSEAEMEDENEDSESQHAGSTDVEDDEEEEGESGREEQSESEGEEEGETEEEEEESESEKEEDESDSKEKEGDDDDDDDDDGSEEEAEGGDEEGEWSAEREEIRNRMQLKKQIKRQQQQRQIDDKVILQRQDKMNGRNLSRVTGGEEADANVSTADNSTGGEAVKLEATFESESELSDSPAICRARRVGAAAEKEPKYNKRTAVQLLRGHRLKRMQKLSTVKNCGKLSQSAIQGAQYMTLFEGCYKGAMGAIVALTVDTSKGLLVGAGYGRHVLVWNVRSRKLLFKVYLKQQLRTILLRCSRGVKRHELQALDQQEKQNSQLHEEQQLQKHQNISKIRKQKPQQQRDPQHTEVKQKRSEQLQQSPQQVSSMVQRKATTLRQEEVADTCVFTKKWKQQGETVPQSQVQRRRPGQQLCRRQHHTFRTQEEKGVGEGANEGDGDGRGRKRSATEKEGIAVVRKPKPGLSHFEQKKKKKKQTM